MDNGASFHPRNAPPQMAGAGLVGTLGFSATSFSEQGQILGSPGMLLSDGASNDEEYHFSTKIIRFWKVCLI